MSLVRAARGFSCMFWGIPLGLLLFSSHTAGFSGAISIGLMKYFRLPAYTLAVLVMFFGAINLYRANIRTRSWPVLVRLLVVSILLQLYFAPFYHWWDRHPYEDLFMLNVIGLLLSTTWCLYLINQVAALAGLAGDEDTFYIEAKLCAWSVLVLMALPIGGSSAYAIVQTFRFDTSVFSELTQLSQGLHTWAYALLLLPFTLTMASCWKAKETCLLGLRTLSGEAEAAEGPDIEAVESPVGPTAD
jgi:hypothetical protein